ncbi:MAG TPA: methyltransferase domain-containing protein [Acidimicrobiales bacterium]|nr:methyltransferase domain-containing protein [Acidimicrobiales bacterium]
MTEAHRCRSCRATAGEVVLDLGEQPASDHFPPAADPGPDPTYPLQMWLCAACGLAQLLVDPTVPEEPRATEPAALVEQAVDAVGRVAAAGWLRAGGRVAEYGSPHGGSWLDLMAERGLTVVGDGAEAEVVLDCFGLMHHADQAAALAERAARVAPGGVLMLQYHSLGTIVRLGQWNSLRHGHYAYYSTAALGRMLASVGFVARQAWRFELYGGTILLAATRAEAAGPGPDATVTELEAEEAALGVEDPARVRALQDSAVSRAEALHRWLADQRAAGTRVFGYGAASRAVALLCRAGVDRSLLPAVADASPAKHGRRMPATDIPVVPPSDLVATRPEAVALFLPDLLRELRATLPEVEAGGGRWVDVEALGATPV